MISVSTAVQPGLLLVLALLVVLVTVGFSRPLLSPLWQFVVVVGVVGVVTALDNDESPVVTTGFSDPVVAHGNDEGGVAVLVCATGVPPTPAVAGFLVSFFLFRYSPSETCTQKNRSKHQYMYVWLVYNYYPRHI